MTKITAYKGFNADWTCRDFQYEVGKTYRHKGEVTACSNGFHACENPLDVFGYYGPATSKFAIVKLSGKTARGSGGDTKIAAAKIEIEVELTLPEFIKTAVAWIIDNAKNTDTNTGNQSAAINTGYQSATTNTGNQSAAINTGNYSAATNTGNYSAATNTGNYSAAINTGNQSAATNTGNYSAATNTGNQSAATNTGNQSAATNTGNYSAAINTGYCSAATNTGNQSAAINTGNRSAATNTGNYSAAINTGNRSAATNTGNYSAAINTGNYSAAINTGNRSAAKVGGKNSHAINTGICGKASSSKGSAIYLAEYDDKNNLKANFAGIAGRGGIKPDTFYTLKDGKPVECEQ